VAKGNRDKKPIVQVKQGQLNFTGNLSIREHAFVLFTFDDGKLTPSSLFSCFKN
jgi:hypothetical protein